ncbi:MAG: hypothetical protein K8R99_12185 [Actinomycetia bacterium]|nr:hypothetical protein [Actinomycetes bacterium]
MSLADIDQRLAAIESVNAHAALIEQANARVVALASQRFQMRIDLVVLASNLQLVANVTAQRLEGTEQRLDQVAKQLAALSGAD